MKWIEKLQNKSPAEYVFLCGMSVIAELVLGSLLGYFFRDGFAAVIIIVLIVFTIIFWVTIAQGWEGF